MNWTNFTIGLSVITIVVMGFIVLSPAHASSGCLDKHENVSRFNPTELSDYQKCVHEHYGNETGVVGKYIWMQHNGDYIYIPIADLAGKSEEAMVEVIVERIVIVEIEAERADLLNKLTVLESLNDESLSGVMTELRKKLDNYYPPNAPAHAKIEVRIDGKEVSAYTMSVDNEITYIMNTFDSIEQVRKNVANLINAKVAAAMQQAYDDGYADGYADGYVAGYNQAVADQNN